MNTTAPLTLQDIDLLVAQHAPAAFEVVQGFVIDRRDGFTQHKPSASLDAMHLAWKTLTSPQHETFRYALQRIVWIEGHVEGPCRSVCNGMADQRARAFIAIFDPVLFAEIQDSALERLAHPDRQATRRDGTPAPRTHHPIL